MKPQRGIIDIKHLPDPMIGKKDYYLLFGCDVLWCFQEEDFCVQPSFVKEEKAKATTILSMCTENVPVESCHNIKNGESCTRGVLSVREKNEIQSFLDNCGATLKDFALSDNFHVFISESTIALTLYEKEYYSVG